MVLRMGMNKRLGPVAMMGMNDRSIMRGNELSDEALDAKVKINYDLTDHYIRLSNCYSHLKLYDYF